VAFNFDDVRAATDAPASDTATLRTFDGDVITFNGRRDGDKAFVSVSASHDAALAAQFAAAPAGPAAPATPGKKIAERIAARAQGVEFEVPGYKYEALFRPYEELLEAKTP
jgi:hypothetical protein